MSFAEAQAIDRVRELVGARLGLHLDDDRVVEMTRLVTARMRGLRLSRMTDYARRVESCSDGAGELAWLASRLTVSETYFFRDRAQLDALADELRRLERTHPDRPIHVLSAGCATGEEAYTVAMLAIDHLIEPDRISVVGADIDAEALERAEGASYGEWSLRQTPPGARERHFTRRRGQYVVSERVRRLVDFVPANLTRREATIWRPAHYDAVLCRNVIMYLKADAARTVGTSLASALRPGGLLLLGHADRLVDPRDFSLLSRPGAFLHRRKAPTEPSFTPPRIRPLPRRPRKRRALRFERPAEPARVPPRPLDQVLTLLQEDRIDAALEALGTLPAGAAAPWMRAALFADAGATDEAIRSCDAQIAAGSLDAELRHVLALCHEQRREISMAMTRSREAAYLDPRFAMPHLHLGRLLRRAGDLVEARRELATALELLPGERELRLLFFGARFDRDTLAASCRGELAALGDR